MTKNDHKNDDVDRNDAPLDEEDDDDDDGENRNDDDNDYDCKCNMTKSGVHNGDDNG